MESQNSKLTIPMLLRYSLVNTLNPVYSYNAHKIFKVTFVAVVRQINPQSANIAYTMEDGTGSIDVRQWLDQIQQDSEAEREKRAQIM
jgi:replication factor A2